MNKVTWQGVVVGIVLGIVLAPQIGKIPGLNRLPVI